MMFGEKNIPANSLEARLLAGHVDAAREYLTAFADNKTVDRDRLLQALTVMVMDLDKAAHA